MPTRRAGYDLLPARDGSGSGNVAAGASASARITAVDAEPGMVELAARSVPSAG
ncbi:class I SAM-dependent methyltransferase [Streptomyces sp. NBC_01471]|uniref:hypothetical protein n=1 Tax=Streptomyces sp. NBC_01471 TaxID=2903879 RepID=UPI00324425B2